MQALKWIGIGLAGLLGVVVVAVAAAFLFLDWNDLRGPIGRQASTMLGREVSIDGNLNIDLGDPIRIRAEGIRIANAPWSDDPTMAEIGVVDAALRLWPLLRGNLELPELRVGQPDVILETNLEGEPNWQFDDAPTPDERGDLPVVEDFALEQGLLRYRDPRAEVDVTSELHRITGQGGGGQDFRLAGDGTFIGKPMMLNVSGGSLEALRDGGEPWPVRLESSVGGTQVLVEGQVGDPVQMEGVDLLMSVSGPDASEIAGELGFPVPRTPPYSLSGRLDREGQAWTMRNLLARMGDSDLAGELAVEIGPDRPVVRGQLTSQRLEAKDFTGLAGAAPEAADDYPTLGPDRVLPAAPIDLAALRHTDLDIQFTGETVVVPYVPLHDLNLHARLEAGRLSVQPLSLGVASGEMAGGLMLDGSQDVPTVETDLELHRIRIAEIFQETPIAEEMGGILGGQIQLTGRGNTAADILGSVDGRISAAAGGGQVSNLIMSALETDILETIGLVLTGDEPIPFNCVVADFRAENGVLRSESLVFDAENTVIWGQGSANLGNETLDLRIEGQPKDVTLMGTNVPVNIQGTFASPDISVEVGETVARGAVAALGALVNPLAALIPFIQPGEGEDAPCAQLVEQAQTRDGSG